MSPVQIREMDKLVNTYLLDFIKINEQYSVEEASLPCPPMRLCLK
jgi:hypothetical protein